MEVISLLTYNVNKKQEDWDHTRPRFEQEVQVKKALRNVIPSIAEH